MVKKKKFAQFSLPAAIGTGIAAAGVVSVAIAALAAYLIVAERLQTSSIPTVAALVQFVSAFIGTWVACRAGKEKRLITGATTALGYYLVLLGATALFMDGQYSGILTGLLAVITGSAAAMFAGTGRGKRRVRKHKIPAYR